MSGAERVDTLYSETITAAFAHARHDRIGVAVSGGGDSMALLDMLARHRDETTCHLECVTVDHGLRAEAASEIALVRDDCTARDIPHSVLKWSWDGTGNLQAEAREARYGMIADWARARHLDVVALGHTQDDVAETFLMRLSRRAGVDGLAAMHHRFERHGVSWLRPLLRVSREECRAYLVERGVTWADDPSNESDQFERVKARRVLEALSPLGLGGDVLADVARNMRGATTALSTYAADIAAERAVEDRGDLLLSRRQDDLPFEMMRRLIGRAIQWFSGAAYPPRSEQIVDLVLALEDGAQQTLGGCIVSSKGGTWRMTREFASVQEQVASTDSLWDGRWSLDGPHTPDLTVRALGDAITETPWRQTGLPRQSLLSTPAVFDRDTIVAAPVAGLSNGWRATATGRGTFAAFLLSR